MKSTRRRARRQKNRSNGSIPSTLGGGGYGSTQTLGIPSTMGTIRRSMSYLRFGEAPYSKSATTPGLRISFRQPYTVVGLNAVGSFGMGGSTDPPSSIANAQSISPTIGIASGMPGFAAPFINIPRSFTKFRFRKLTLEYVGQTQTGVSGSFVMAYNPDGDVTYVSSTAANLREMPVAVEAPLWSPNVCLEAINDRSMNDEDAALFYTAQGTSTVDANLRIANQGAVLLNGESSDAVGTSKTYGWLYVEGVLDLYAITNSNQLGSPFTAVELRLQRRALDTLIAERIAALKLEDERKLESDDKKFSSDERKTSTPSERIDDDLVLVRRPVTAVQALKR